jgi:hypothetical protein
MPRARDVVMGQQDPKDLHEAAIRRAIKLHSPYEVVSGDLVDRDPNLYYVVYRAPLGGDRQIVANRSKRGNAAKLRDQLNDAWARGYWSSGREKAS